jgi:hypothetical protein
LSKCLRPSRLAFQLKKQVPIINHLSTESRWLKTRQNQLAFEESGLLKAPSFHSRGTCRVVLGLVALLYITRLLRAQTDSLPQEAAKSLAYAQAWGLEEPGSALAAFHSWTDRFIVASNVTARTQMLSEGLALAKLRRVALAALINSDPIRMLASTVPASVRQQLPIEIANEMGKISKRRQVC